MTVSDYFKINRIFDRRRIGDKLRKGRRSRSSSQEARTVVKQSEATLSTEEEQPPATDAKGAGYSQPGASGASPETAKTADAAKSSSTSSQDDLNVSELPRQPPASTSVYPSASPPAVAATSDPMPIAPEGRLASFDSDVPDDVPCEGTLTTTGSVSPGKLRDRVPSDAVQFGDMEQNPTDNSPPDRIVSNSAPRPSSGSTPRSAPAPTVPTPRGAAPRSASATSCVLCLVGDSLELMCAPGDVLAVKGSGRLTEIGTAHGMLGHVLLVLEAPHNVVRSSEEGLSLHAVWPPGDVEEIWRVHTVESTRSEQGLHEAEMLLYVERLSGQLILIGELQLDGTLVLTEHENIELWQSPAELRSQIRVDIMKRVLADMKANEASWSHVTVARALLTSAQLSSSDTLETVKECWKQEPICTSIVIIFWQRYLCELAVGMDAQQTLELLFRWMPLKADRGLPGDLMGAMSKVGWVTVSQVPRIFRPMVFSAPSSKAGHMAVPRPKAAAAESSARNE